MKPVDFKELFVTIEKCILGGKQGRAE